MSNILFSCAKQIFATLADVQSQIERVEQHETAFAVLKDSKGFLEAKIKSPLEDGQNAVIGIKVNPISCEPALDCDGTALCNTTGEKVPTPIWKEVIIDNCIKSKAYTIKEEDYNSLCAGKFSDGLMNAFNLGASQIRMALNNKALAFLSANASMDLGALPLLNANGSGNFPQFNKIKQEFRKRGLSNVPNVIGGVTIDTAKSTFNVTDRMSGLTPNQMGGLTFWYDSWFDTISSNPNLAYAFAPQSVQLISYCKYGDNSQYGHTIKGQSLSDVMAKYWSTSNVNGRIKGCVPVFLSSIDSNQSQAIWCDFEIITDNCGAITVQLSLLYKFVNIYTTICDTNFNGILKFEPCPIPEITCTIPNNPPLPYIAKTFDWKAPCNPNEMIYNMSLGGTEYTGVPMKWDGTLPTLAFIINAFYGKQIVMFDGTNIVTQSPFAGSGLTGGGAFNDGINTFNFL